MPSSHASTGAHQLTDDDKRFRNFAGVDRHPDTLTSINNLATLLQAKATDDALEQARPLLVEAAAVSKQGEDEGSTRPKVGALVMVQREPERPLVF
jgi:hypothetical protein